ncbi:hypothetical protein EON65_58675 [archaeon]|nr:MAG: hypothetical protein EON65_58675 [archaeon]
MTTQFLSRVEREMKTSPYVDVGPGSYDKPGGITQAVPGFAPFASSARRMSTMRESHSPSPGNYNIAEDMTSVSSSIL